MTLRWRKVLRDFHASFWRTILVSLAILIGVTAIATTFGASAILDREMQASYESTHPAAIIVWLDTVDDALVAQVRQLPGVENAAARRLLKARAEVAAGDWRRLWIFGVEEFQNLSVSTFRSEQGDFPPKAGDLLIERSAAPVLQSELGKTLRVRTPSGAVSDLRISGIVHDPGLAPGWMDNLGYAYATPKTLAMLGEGEFLNELRITIGEGNRQKATQIATDLSQWLTDNGYSVRRIEALLRQHVHASQMDAMLGLLRGFSLSAIALSGALAANVTTALVAKQVRQIGIMKAIGATRTQVFDIYIRLVLLLSIAPVMVGIPIGTITAKGFSAFVAGQLNVDITNWTIPLWLFGLEALIGLSVPLTSATIPILRATQITAHGAIQATGIHPSPHNSSSRSPPFPIDRTLILSLRNSFRRPVRLGLTLAALAIGGAILMTCVNVYASLVGAMDQSLAMRGDDVEVRLLNPAPADKLTEQTLQLPGVKAVETWGMTLAALELPHSPVNTERYNLFAPPNNTKLFQLHYQEGRPVDPNEQGAVVINGGLIDREHSLSLKVGSELGLWVKGGRTTVRVVGIVEEIGEFAMYTNPRTLAALTGTDNNAMNLRIVTHLGSQAQVVKAVEQSLVESGWFPTFVMSHADRRQAMTDHFLILLMILSGAAFAVVLVGGLGLATTMSLNVLERSREIGILRAMGATRNIVLRILILEGTAIAVLSVVIAILLSIPLSAAIGNLLGKVGLHVTLPFIISPLGIASWLGLVAITTVIACLLPAQAALRQAVQTVLSYE